MFLPILVRAQAPANDLCANAIPLSSALTCNNISGTVVNATYTATLTDCGGNTPTYDVWYSFVAVAPTMTVTLSSPGANFNTPRLQVFSGTCGGFTSVVCSTSPALTVTPTGMTVGNTYYLRVYSRNGAAPISNGAFNLCITYPMPDACASAVSLNSGPTCNYITGTVANSTNDGGTGCPGTERYDVWYRFVAKSTDPTITLANIGANFVNPLIEVRSGSCAGASIQCGGTSPMDLTGLTINTTYYIRVYSTTLPIPTTTANFDICVTDPPPANNECDAPPQLTPGTACVNTGGNFYASTTSVNTIAGSCAGAVTQDVWYYFQASAANATVTLSGLGANVTGSSVQILSGGCGNFVSIACGSPAASSTSLIPGNYYYIRVYRTGPVVTTPTGSNFNICVTYTNPVGAPANDNCVGAISITPKISCVKTMGTTVNATLSGLPFSGTCSGTVGPDVWYSFIATAANTTITLADFGANFGATRRLMLYDNVCGSLNVLNCAQGTGNSVGLNPTTLTIGATYYVRVFSGTVAAPTSYGDFSLCIYATPNFQRFGNSYVNITKQTTGGVVQNGDILEIRMTVNHSQGTSNLQNMRYVDSVPKNTAMLTAATDRLRVITNQGIAVHSFTLGGGDDGGVYVASPPAGSYQIRMNLGFGTTLPLASPGNPVNTTATEFASATGVLTGTNNIPRGGSGTLFATSFRVRVTGAVGDTIVLGAGKFIYRTSAGGPDIILTGTPYKILITSPLSLCANATGINMSEENGGTFGAGSTLNRPTDLAFPIPGYDLVKISATQGLGDGQYSIVNNMSPRSGVDRTAERSPTNTTPLPSQQASAYRMHGGHWDIDGDHTGTNNGVGNIPQADGVNSGYMLMVNADYVASETYRQTVSGLCPNTYYEFSAWVRNICPTCGINYTTGANPTPRQSGVRPNLTFSLNGLDYYNTGEIDSASGWVKKGFVFITGPNQDSATFSIRNNSQGGGGNDWVMDDITVATCLPNMSYSPSLNPVVCMGNAITLNDTVTSFFNNYTHYKWQKSTAGGGAWTDIAGFSGTATPVPVTGGYRYITSYTVPTADAQLANNGDRYRLIVATTGTNLSDTACNVTDGISIIDVNVIDCTPVLKTELINFNGRLESDKGILTWSTSNEEKNMKYFIERSNDGRTFEMVGTLNAGNNSQNVNYYTFPDPVSINDKAWYRLVLVTADGKKKYSAVILLTNNLPDFDFVKVVNPFSHNLEFDLSVNTNSMINISLIDMSGKVVRSGKQMVYTGTNSLTLKNTDALPAGVYTLRIMRNERLISRRVVKTN